MARHQSREFKVKDTDQKVEEADNNLQNDNTAAQPDALPSTDFENNTLITEPSAGSLSKHNLELKNSDHKQVNHTNTAAVNEALFDEQEAWELNDARVSSRYSPDQIGQAVDAVIQTLNIHKGQRKAYQESMERITGQMSKTLSASSLFSSARKSSSAHAGEKGSSASRLILYYATAQAMVTMMLGFKHIFRMLDTPSDAGSKALSISYAAAGLLGIHLVMLVALAKHFF